MRGGAFPLGVKGEHRLKTGNPRSQLNQADLRVYIFLFDEQVMSVLLWAR
jgi:hypothetical protein